MSIPQKDQYENFRFRLRWEGRYVAGFREAGALGRTTEIVEPHHNDPSTRKKVPGQAKHPRVTLERGVTYNADFQRWASETSSGGLWQGHRD